jgi:hypothetical protein
MLEEGACVLIRVAACARGCARRARRDLMHRGVWSWCDRDYAVATASARNAAIAAVNSRLLSSQA